MESLIVGFGVLIVVLVIGLCWSVHLHLMDIEKQLEEMEKNLTKSNDKDPKVHRSKEK